MKIRAMAKVNLGLDVLRRREDGYHEVKMIMQTVNLYDELDINIEETGKIIISCNREDIELDERNLIYKAILKLKEKKDFKEGISVKLTKNIPIAAGMAGGSTDAAATLVGVNKLLNLGLSVQELKEIGVKIGADVPYCIEGGTQLSEGIGEVLTKLDNTPNCVVLVAKPQIGVSTKYVYENLHVENIDRHPDIDGMIEGIKKQDIATVAEKMENILENVTEKKYPEIAKIKAIMKDNKAMNALMSGSGPTVFGLFKCEDDAVKAKNVIFEEGLAKDCFVTEFVYGTCVV